MFFCMVKLWGWNKKLVVWSVRREEKVYIKIRIERRGNKFREERLRNLSVGLFDLLRR